MDGPPPPPPPHGANPKTTGGSPGSGGLPAGNYDIFIIPPHSSGGGFVYLPSLQVQRNSFLAGVGSTLAAIAVWFMVEPTLKLWFMLVTQSVSSGGNGVILLVVVVGVAGWAWGKTQGDGGYFGGPGNGPHGGAGAGAGASGANYQRGAPPPPHGSYPGTGAPPPPPQGAQGAWGGQHQQRGANAPHDGESWSGSQPDPDARAHWEQAREEQRKKDEEKKKKEEEQKKAEEAKKAKEEADRQAKAKAEKEKWEKMRAREREQRERDARERIAKDRAKKDKDAKEKAEQERLAREAEARAKIEREVREKLEAEQKAKAAEEALKKAAEEKAQAEAAAAKAKADAERAERLKAARERAQRDREARVKAEAEKIKAGQAKAAADSSAGRRSTTYGGMGGGEKLDPYAGARSPPPASVTSTHSSPIKATVTPKKNYERPSAQSYVGTEDEHSFRPYDTPKRPPKPPSHASSYTASSYAPSASTARTTPPASQRGPYSTNDPDKIQIKAVFLFNDLFPKPVAQLVANVGKVTDGLILKVQSEGLFIDDDVRSIPQREWDVKAWTLKLVETGQNTSKHLHILRASVRDTDGKKYVFLIDESESWKLAIGLQRLRKGSQVRSLQNTQMGPGEVTRILNAVPPMGL